MCGITPRVSVRPAAMPTIPRRLQGLQLTDLQQRIVDTAMQGKPVLVYRTGAKHGYGCTVLGEWLECYKGFSYASDDPPRWLKQQLENPEYKGFVYDMPCAMQGMTAKRNNMLRVIERTPSERPVVVFYHGKPPAWLKPDVWTVLDITEEAAARVPSVARVPPTSAVGRNA